MGFLHFGLIALATTPSPAVGGDLSRFQGTWTAVAGPRGDMPVVLEIAGNQAKVRISTPRGLKIRVQGELRIDETVRPKALDWVKFTGVDGQDFPEIQAIYELNGDTLKLRNGGLDDDRPTEFTPGDGALADVLIFTHRKGETEGNGAGQDMASAPTSR